MIGAAGLTWRRLSGFIDFRCGIVTLSTLARMKTMRQILTLLALLGVVALCSGVALAHPPSDIKLSLDPASHLLTVTAMHQTMDATKHYVGEIDVWLNDNLIVMQKFSGQTDTATQVASYVINAAKTGDTIRVNAVCNIHGSKTVESKVEDITLTPQPKF